MQETHQHIYIECPKHVDTKPSLCINKVWHNGRPVGYFYCYSCGYTGMVDREKVIALSKIEAKTRIPTNIDWAKENARLQKTLAYTLPDKLFNVDWYRMHTYGIGWDGKAYTFPMYNSNRDVIGIQRRWPDGTKKCIEGSRLGLFLPEHTAPRMGIVEGVSDAIIAHECGLPTIGLPCAACGHEMAKTFVLLNNVDEVLLIGDNNEAGRNSVDKLKRIFPHGIFIRSIDPKAHKDLRDYYDTHGKDATRRLLK